MTEAEGSTWYAVQTHVHVELKAASQLQRQGYGVYLPRFLKRRRHARRVDTIAAPLFPRYLFVSVTPQMPRRHAIRSTVGVVGLLCYGDTPAVVQQSIISDLQARHDEQGFVRLDSAPRFSRGDKIRVQDGAFVDCIGLFDGMAERQRVAILLNFLGRQARVVLDRDSVAAA